MTQGRSIRLFLVDGTPSGLFTAEIMNWTGHVLAGPRTKLSELVQRPECGRTGIYFLVGPDPDNSLRPLVYIGESDDVSTRLKQHNRPEMAGPGGGKDFWERVCLITSKDQNLTKAHVKYLESQLIKQAADIGRCKLTNGTAHEYINLPESDRADMAFFVEQIRTVLPVLGFDFLRGRAHPTSQQLSEAPTIAAQSPRFSLEVPRHGIKATGQEIDGEFFVLEGAIARDEWIGVNGGYKALYQQLCSDGVLVKTENGLRRFVVDYAFSSPSAAAAVVSGRSANGREQWKVEATGQTYASWQDQKVSAASAVTKDTA
ncbi:MULTISPECIES: GIY-YIG nuclease family protein [unclassified Halomonas]|uniref:GIY-YIG nuclease family protein n=1 Tax=unclassified Halomonas TaxID=2609666 RepID=UPI00209FC4C5|nr:MULTISPECIES: GIY-YIG nuclease family protein [unclassified Halomonas]MCP1314230.1 GIY-YIG nuclease family protein [Halomonas sp. 707D7]MCP1325326.1 GIY-YIG nuclease family protein [Halomonas sp. 707D4]